MIHNENKFNVILASSEEYERLVAEIFYEDKFIALVSQERGEGEFDLEFPGNDLDEKFILRKCKLLGFQNALLIAIKRLTGEIK